MERSEIRETAPFGLPRIAPALNPGPTGKIVVTPGFLAVTIQELEIHHPPPFYFGNVICWRRVANQKWSTRNRCLHRNEDRKQRQNCYLGMIWTLPSPRNRGT